ncbi:MAG: hypothetical protein NT069_21970, partial [Planctomycetota bacterium]|nr:hypothetical protein [Planctomycetota bacterium]
MNRIKSLEHLPVAATEMLLTKENPKGKFDGISLKVPEDEAGEKGNAKGGGKGSGEKGGGEKGSDKGSGKKDGNLRIPPQNSWWLALDAKSTEPHGRSRFSGAPYRVYKRRAEVIRLRDIFIQKLVLQGGVAHVPENVIMENGVVLDVFEEMGKAHDERISGALMVLSNARDANGNYLYDITDPASTLDPAPLDNHLDGLDSEQLQAFGIPPKTITEGEAQGSFAMVSQQKLILDAVVEGILKQIEQSFQEFVLDRTVEYNFMKPAGVDLTISHEPLLSPENVIVAQLIEAIMTAPELPQIITSGAVDLMKILEKARIPLLPGAKAAIDKIFKAAQKMAEAGGVAGGGARSGDQGATSETGAGDGGVD